MGNLPHQHEIDIHEQIAMDIEASQQKRHNKTKSFDEFWNAEKELALFEMIKTHREASSTFHPDTQR